VRYNSEKKIIGRLERVDFPEWELYDIQAKVDTGAYTSSLHCHHIENIEKNGKTFVRFNLLDPTHDAYNEKKFELPTYDIRDVKSSNGTIQRRFVVRTILKIFNIDYPVELSLTDRSEMKNPVLLGRRFLNKKFIVDPSKVNISKKSLSKGHK